MKAHKKKNQIAGDSTDQRASARSIILLVIILLALRIPFWNHPIPVHPDEEAFIAGAGFPAEYPVHPPGYPLWIFLGTLLARTGLSPYSAYQVWSLLASVAAPLLLYHGLRWFLNGGVAWWLALTFGANPLVWFQSTAALTYLPATVVGLLVVGLCYQTLVRESRTGLLWISVTLSLGLFLRPDLLIYLGLLFAYVAWRLRKRGGIPAMIILMLGCLAFYGLTFYLYSRSEGTSAAARLGHTRDVVLGTSVFRLGLEDGLLRNLVKIGINVVWDFGLATILLLPSLWLTWRNRRRNPHLSVLLFLWLLPGGLFLLLMHVVQGYFMLLIPAGYVIIGSALQLRCKPKLAQRIAALTAIASLGQFLFYPWSAESCGLKRLLDAKIAFQSAAGLRHIDQRKEIHRQGDYWPTRAHE